MCSLVKIKSSVFGPPRIQSKRTRKERLRRWLFQDKTHDADYAGAYVLLASRRYGLTTSGSVLDVANAKGLVGRVADDLLARRG